MIPTVAFSGIAYPNPFVDPKETIMPPRGNWFWLISTNDLTMDPSLDVMPV